MSDVVRRRNAYFKKGCGFSQYNNNGDVIYSESITSVGETVRHFYFYDEFNRRIRYLREEPDNTFEEITRYLPNGTKEITTMNFPEHNICVRKFNSLGRLVEEETQDWEGNCMRRIYDAYRDKYIVTRFKYPFIYKK